MSKNEYDRLNNREIQRKIIVVLLLLQFVACHSAAEAVAGDSDAAVFPRLVPGWPVFVGNKNHGTPAVADIDGDGRDEVAVALKDGRVYLFDGRGRALPGWPQAAAYWVTYSPAMGDVDGDGDIDVVVGSWDGYVYAWECDGRPLPGWPVDCGAKPVSSPQLLSLDPESEIGILIACDDGRVHLLDSDGKYCPGWPQYAGRASAEYHDTYRIRNADIDENGVPEILYLSSRSATLYAWSATGAAFPGFPVTLGGRGNGIALDDNRRPIRIACTTTSDIVVLDRANSVLFRTKLPEGDGEFTAAPAFVSIGGKPDTENDVLFAGTTRGVIYAWDRNGRSPDGWPVRIGGFIYGLTGAQETASIDHPPLGWDVDGDDRPEILVGSTDQHLYCFDLEGNIAPGWPLTLDDHIVSAPSFAQLDGVGRKELVIGQYGESIFAFHLDPRDAAPERSSGGAKETYGSGEWSRFYYAVVAIVLLLGGLLVFVLRAGFKNGSIEFGRGAWRWVLVTVFVALVLTRGVLFFGEIPRYVNDIDQLGRAGPIIERVVAGEQKRVNNLAATIASELDSCLVIDSNNPIELLYHMEMLADRFRLDYRHSGILVTDSSDHVIQTVGLAREWRRVEELDMEIPGSTNTVLAGTTPVLIGRARTGGEDDPGTLVLFSSLLQHLPYLVVDATGGSAHVRLNGRTLAWAGASPMPFRRFRPWTGIVEPSYEIPLRTTSRDASLSLRLAVEDFGDRGSWWLDLFIVLFSPVLFLAVARRPATAEGSKSSWWWLVLFAALYLAGFLLFGEWRFYQRPVSPAGHVLECTLHLFGLLGLAVGVRSVVGAGRGSRLSLAVVLSYLVVGLLPLVVVLVITAGLLQQAQRQVIRDALGELEERADHLVMAYASSTKFIGGVGDAAGRLLSRRPETDYYSFVGEDELLYGYDLPSAYLTLRVHDRADPGLSFTGFSWRAPRSEKFFPRLPAWMGDRNQRGIFVEGGDAVIRAARRFHNNHLDIQLVSHVPLDRTILETVEERLRILPFLPRVRLRPAWQESEQAEAQVEGWDLPFSTTQVLPARDWRTGAERWIAYRASAYLPAGGEKWTVLAAVLFLSLLPLVLSFGGAYSTYQRTVRPLTRLLTGIRRVEEGDLEYRLAEPGVPASGRPGSRPSEIALTANAFDRMAESLQANVRELAEKKKIEEISELKTRFISMVSHDLKTPIASIKGATENILTELAGPVTEKQRAYLQMILSSSKNLQKMISDLLDLSQIESGRLVLKPEILDLKREAENVLRSVKPLLDEREIDARITNTARNTSVRADRTRLWQILNNIISNAIHYSPSGGRIDILIEGIRVDAENQNDMLKTTITDRGPGIPESDRARSFEPFYTGPAGLTGKKGAGLGLAIVKQLVELHEGTVALESGAQGGTSIAFTLPAADRTRS